MPTTDRIIDLSSEGARLSVNLDRLVIDSRDAGTTTVPMEEVGVLVGAHKALVYTHSVLSRLAEHGGIFVACNDQRMPVAMMAPLAAHHRATERMRLQAEAGQPMRKRLWQQIVQSKIRAQGKVLTALRNDDGGLTALAATVRSGDPNNREAMAARRYWPRLFDDKQFRRDPDAPDQNRYLNYGYAILRAMVARAACASGLHPALPLHHHNRYNAWPLADDLMEPFRPLIDASAVEVLGEYGPDRPLDKEVKSRLIRPALERYNIGGELRTLDDCLRRMAASLASVLEGEGKDLTIPEV